MSVSAELDIYPPDSTQATLRQIGLGIQPLILIEPLIDEADETVNFKITSSLLDQEELTEVISLINTILSEGETQDESEG